MQRELLDAESVARHLVKRGSVFGLPPGMFPDAMFTNLFPAGRGRASVAAGVKQGGRHLGFARDLICEMPHTPGDADPYGGVSGSGNPLPNLTSQVLASLGPSHPAR